MTGTKIMKNRILIALSLIIVLILGSAEFLYADDSISMPNLTRDSSTLTVETKYTDEDVTIPVNGVKLSAYKVADLSVVDGKVNYTPTKDFESLAIDYNSLTTSISIEIAKELYSLVESSNIKGMNAVSDRNGVAEFGSVDHGMYLVVQTGATGAADEYSWIGPYIVTAPQSMAELGENEWEYDVVSMPKMELRSDVEDITEEPSDEDSGGGKVNPATSNKSEETTTTVTTTTVSDNGTKTGDEFAMYLRILLIMMAASVLTIIIILTRRRKAKN